MLLRLGPLHPEVRRDALAVLAAAPSPQAGRALTAAKIASVPRLAGRQRNIDATAGRIHVALRREQLAASPGVVGAYTASVKALVGVITELTAQVEVPWDVQDRPPHHALTQRGAMTGRRVWQDPTPAWEAQASDAGRARPPLTYANCARQPAPVRTCPRRFAGRRACV